MAAPTRFFPAYSSLRYLLLVGALARGPLATAHGDPITDWNRFAADEMNFNGVAGNPTTRAMAIMHLSINDAVVSITHSHPAYLGQYAFSGPASPEAAALSAGHRAVSRLFPALAGNLGSYYAAALTQIPDGPAKTTGIALGQQSADAMIAFRAADGSSGSGSYPGGTQPGQWRPTPPAFQSASQPHWRDVAMFSGLGGDAFRAPRPPALASGEYADAFAEVASLGKFASLTRTPDQTNIAYFWDPAAHLPFNEIARTVSALHGLSLSENARLFALLDAAIADSRVVAWDTKYEYGFWRPVTAIPLADTDGNPDTLADPSWSPLLRTPNHPAYTSSHSMVGAVSATVSADWFGDAQSFSVSTTSTVFAPGTTRSFSSFSEAAAENGRSRIYGGIHWQFDDESGQASGRELGEYVVSHLLVPEPRTLEQLATAVVMSLVFWTRKRIAGCHSWLDQP